MDEKYFTNPPKLSITNSILGSIGKIEAAKEVIENSPLIPTYDRQFKSEALARTVHYATALEGNLLNFTEVKKILENSTGHGVIARERDVQEVINYRKVIDFIDRLVKAGEKVIDQKIIAEVNSLVTEKMVGEESRGKYREVGAVSRNSATLETTMVWPEPSRVPWLMGELIGWLNSENFRLSHPVLRAGLIHTWFVLIHPFAEGNGRSARALSTLSLCLSSYNVKNFFCLEEYYDRDPQSYYSAIKTVVSEGGDYTKWLEYFSQGLAVEYHRTKERVLKLSRDLKIKEVVGGQIALSERQEKIIEHIRNFGRLVNAEFNKLFPEISEDTVLREIADLTQKNIIVKRGKTKAARYELK